MLKVEEAPKMLKVEEAHQATELEKPMNFRPGPASYVYRTCVSQISAVSRALKISGRAADEQE